MFSYKTMIETYNAVNYAIENIDGNYLLGHMKTSKQDVACIFPEYCSKNIDKNISLFELDGVELPGTWSDNFCKEMIEKSAKSHFGNLKNCETTLDEKVRNSYEITTGLKFTTRGAIEFNTFCSKTSKLLYGRNVCAKIEKLIIYPPGGFFKEHQDTPKDGYVGSIICTFPGRYDGGRLRVGSGCFNSNKNQYTLVSFYGNTLHSIDKIYEGFRISIVLSMHYDDNICNESNSDSDSDNDSDNDSDSDSDDDNYDDGDDDEEDEEGCPSTSEKPFVLPELCIFKIMEKLKRGNLGIILSHKYSNDEIQNKTFKSLDFLIVNEFDKNNILYEIAPVLLHFHKTRYPHDDGTTEKSCKVYSFSEKDIKNISEGIYEESELTQKYKGTEFIGFCGESIKSDFQDYVEHTGNECRPEVIDNFYYQVAIICNKINE